MPNHAASHPRLPLSRGTVYETPPEADAPTRMSRRDGLATEAAIVREPFRLAWRTPALARVPRGDGRLTIVIPGWLAPERSMAPLRTFLARAGHDARHWGLGVIRNDVETMRDRFVERLGELVDDRPAALVGWSLGGIMAREAARARPDLVDHVVTFGTPAIGGPTYTVGAGRMGDDECRRIEELQRRIDVEQPIRSPITAIFTRADGVVDWRACIDRASLDVRHVEVGSSHVGLGIDPDVWQIIAESLAPARPESA
jgi:pimeloyl-ACP methyl ester carboxylesterase